MLRTMTVLIAFLMFPGSAQLAENVVHMVFEGHGAHALDDEEHTKICEEDACSGGFHSCPCHCSVVFLTSNARVEVPTRHDVISAFARGEVRTPDDSERSSLQRPPRA